MTDPKTTVEKIAKATGGMTEGEKKILRGTLCQMNAAEKAAQRAIAATGDRFSAEVTVLTLTTGETVKLWGHRTARQCFAALRNKRCESGTARHTWFTHNGPECGPSGETFEVRLPMGL